MATLTRPKLATRPATDALLTPPVPAPFPRELLQQQQRQVQQPTEFTTPQVNSQPETQAAMPSLISEVDNIRGSTAHVLVRKYVNCSG